MEKNREDWIKYEEYLFWKEWYRMLENELRRNWTPLPLETESEALWPKLQEEDDEN